MNDFKYFSFDEFADSATAEEHGIDNTIPNETVEFNISCLIIEILDPLRELVGMPIYVTSGYRCNELNRLLKGSKNSQHMIGEAADITTNDAYGNMVMVIKLLCVLHNFDQLILYRQTRDKLKYAWLHVSNKGNGKNRNQVMMCHNGEYKILHVYDQNRLLMELAEQVTLHDNTMKEKYKPSKLKLQ